MVVKKTKTSSNVKVEEKEQTSKMAQPVVKRPREEPTEEVKNIINHNKKSKKPKASQHFSLGSCWKSAASTLKNIPLISQFEGL